MSPLTLHAGDGLPASGGPPLLPSLARSPELLSNSLPGLWLAHHLFICNQFSFLNPHLISVAAQTCKLGGEGIGLCLGDPAQHLSKPQFLPVKCEQ